jgi:hypothetical protein
MKIMFPPGSMSGNERFRMIFVVTLVMLFWNSPAMGQAVKSDRRVQGSRITFTLSNDKVEYSLLVDSNRIISDKLVAQPSWSKRYGAVSSPIETDADFSLEVMWTDWQAPKKINNAENPVVFTKSDFRVDKYEFTDLENGVKQLTLSLQGKDIPVLLGVLLQLDPKSFYVRRKVTISDTAGAGHFLQRIAPIDADVNGKPSVMKSGGFGQPVALGFGKSGGFFGLEYPASDNSITTGQHRPHVRCMEEIGEKIDSRGVESEWVVEGVAPDENVKLWFMRYVDDIRVAPLRPYTLYNSWYDLRSPEYPKVPEQNVMNEKNIFRIIDLIRKNMIEKHDIQLDAFVLDDGWDVYESDWVLREKMFPRGLKPISDELKKTNTGLGLWLGPTGGYSFRMKRIDWMKSRGYEVVGHTRNTAMMCLGGTKYGELFRKRTVDFVAKEGVSFFKWDGIQFSCSEPDHGHPVGIYSRRAVMESLIDKVRAVREKNPNVFLNITSGTWLSPWWVKYANQIWMQGQDYGYADVPSISPRDAAITYRDFVLYDDFNNQNMWFPIANLMTHGIIKGNLEMLGGREEPLDKFTNEALLYFARGVSMWELYISPDILTDGEWNAMSEAMHWARDRFPILSTTEMAGGDPTKGATYGYVHFRGVKGIVAARNPSIEPRPLRVTLSSSLGLDPSASSLVLERVYPTRWVSPKLYKAGSVVDLALDGYETAIYELYPLAEATWPLVAGVPFDVVKSDADGEHVSIYGTNRDAAVLNGDKIKGTLVNNREESMGAVLKKHLKRPEPLNTSSLRFTTNKNGIGAEYTLDPSVREGLLSILLTPSPGGAATRPPQVQISIDGASDTAKFEKGESASTWYTCKVQAGRHITKITVLSRDQSQTWSGHASVWMICQQQQEGIDITFKPLTSFTKRPMPPRPFPLGVVAKNIKLGEAELGGSRTGPPLNKR